MSAPQLQFSNEETLSISGELSFQTVPELVAGHADLFQDAGTLTLDLMAVERADSAGVALLIHWLREAGHHDCTLRFVNLPEQMRAIARVSGVEELLLS